MNDGVYGALSGVYDILNDQVDYSEWADYIEKILKKYSDVPVELMLDLGCGTGKMTFELHSRGYDMTGVDLSPEMLSTASDIAAEKGISDILWLCQDMTDFELYGTVDAAVCCLDGINHLTRSGDLEKCFSLVHNYLVPNGIFIFDVNSPKKFEEVYGTRDYILEDEGVLVAWQNDYDPKRKICDFYLSIFTEDEDGRYVREDSVQRERCFSAAYLKRVLKKCGFEIVSFSGGYDFEPVGEDAHRWYIAAKCIKEIR